MNARVAGTGTADVVGQPTLDGVPGAIRCTGTVGADGVAQDALTEPTALPHTITGA